MFPAVKGVHLQRGLLPFMMVEMPRSLGDFGAEKQRLHNDAQSEGHHNTAIETRTSRQETHPTNLPPTLCRERKMPEQEIRIFRACVRKTRASDEAPDAIHQSAENDETWEILQTPGAENSG